MSHGHGLSDGCLVCSQRQRHQCCHHGESRVCKLTEGTDRGQVIRTKTKGNRLEISQADRGRGQALRRVRGQTKDRCVSTGMY